MTADVFSQTEQAQLNGVSSAKAILAGVDSSQKIPESAKVSFLNTLGTVEKSSSVRIFYSRMSD
ncbi:MAG: hypothetical protein LBT89_04035 [Planctomycetaceae bacterium]|nr:hypothetical protein [Planctomycetaceae bacterium]